MHELHDCMITSFASAKQSLVLRRISHIEVGSFADPEHLLYLCDYSWAEFIHYNKATDCAFQALTYCTHLKSHVFDGVAERRHVEVKAPGIIARKFVHERMQTRLKAIYSMAPMSHFLHRDALLRAIFLIRVVHFDMMALRLRTTIT